MSEWITDRLPTEEDAFEKKVFVYLYKGAMVLLDWRSVKPGEPWQPIPRPAPYVKPQRWRVTWYEPNNCWHVIDTTINGVMGYLHLDSSQVGAAQRICDIYNEVMP